MTSFMIEHPYTKWLKLLISKCICHIASLKLKQPECKKIIKYSNNSINDKHKSYGLKYEMHTKCAQQYTVVSV